MNRFGAAILLHFPMGPRTFDTQRRPASGLITGFGVCAASTSVSRWIVRLKSASAFVMFDGGIWYIETCSTDFRSPSTRSRLASEGPCWGARLESAYRAEWFDPRAGAWRDAGGGTLRSSAIGTIMLPDVPSDTDWGLRLMLSSALP